ncbi:MAG TPA: serine hydrolase domain-containing protein [Polyangia bacterium]|nr:serine hydrolase domain-containing protein [Polyangia bacterium]
MSPTRLVLALALSCAGCARLSAPSAASDAKPPVRAQPNESPFGAGITLPPPVPYPSPDWPTGTPADAGLDSTKLDQAASIAEANGSYCLLIIRHGALVYERYFAGTDASTPHKSWSLAKSYSGTLVGIAIDRGDIKSLDDAVADYVPELVGTDRASITVRDLVSMTSGLQWSAFQDYVAMAALAPDDTKFALGLALSDPPGSKWIYHNGAVQLLEPLFRGATGLSIEQYAAQHLWSKIGMSATWAHDLAGHPTPYANVLATCRDHARLGYLYLHGGRWRSEQVIAPTWIAQALAPSQPFNRAYGFLFWLNRETPAVDAMMNPWPDRMSPIAPKDLFAARGFGNQFVDVIPSLDLLVIRFGTDPLTNADVGALIDDARFTKHDDILAPVLDAVVAP